MTQWKKNNIKNKKKPQRFCFENLQPKSRLNVGLLPDLCCSTTEHMCCNFLIKSITLGLNSGCIRWQSAGVFLIYVCGEGGMQTLYITHLCTHVGDPRITGADVDVSPLCEKQPLLWLWSDAGGKTRKVRREGGWVGREGGCLWNLNWHSRTSVVIYLSHPSDSNSYTLRCLYILTLGLQGHNLKRYPVKNVEKYKIKNRHVRRESKWREGPEHKEEDTVKPFTQGLQITNNGAKPDAQAL